MVVFDKRCVARVDMLWALCCLLLLTTAFAETQQRQLRRRGRRRDYVSTYEAKQNCTGSSNTRSIDAYYINLEKSWRRRAVMEAQFQDVTINVTRIAGATPEQVHVKEMANFSFKTKYENNLSMAEDGAEYIVDVLHGHYVRMKPGYHDHSNTPKELACFLSHLIAIYKAVYSHSCSRYALIMEDDVYFGYDIDFSALLKLAPTEPWGTLQLFTNNADVVVEQYNEYLNLSDVLFSKRRRRDEWWSLGAAVIDKAMWKPVIDKLMYTGGDGKLHFKVIASVQRKRSWKCAPYMCCDENGKYINELPCFKAYSGFQADMIIYEYLPTFTLKFPIFNLYPKMSKKSQIQEQKTTEQMNNFTEIIVTTVSAIMDRHYSGEVPVSLSNVIRKFNSANFMLSKEQL